MELRMSVKYVLVCTSIGQLLYLTVLEVQGFLAGLSKPAVSSEYLSKHPIKNNCLTLRYVTVAGLTK